MHAFTAYLPSAVRSVVLINTVTCDSFLSAKKESFSTMALVRSGFEKANSGNLPSVDIFMVTAFLNESECFNAAEIRGYKAHRSGRESYGDSAVGYVQLRRERNTCVLKARVCPEHRIHSTAYEVKAVIDETEEEIKEINCKGCAASLGGCKHALAFLMWLHRRSEEPAPTEIECYWAKSKLSGVGRSLKCVAAKNMGKKKKADSGSSTANSTDFLNAIIEHCEMNKLNTQLSGHSFEEENKCLKRLSLHRLCQDFLMSGTSVSNILSFFRNVCNPEMCSEIEVNTRGQSENHLWHEMRYGRITASIFHAAANCRTKDGSLVQQILGGPKMHSSLAMKRGQKLESKFVNVVLLLRSRFAALNARLIAMEAWGAWRGLRLLGQAGAVPSSAPAPPPLRDLRTAHSALCDAAALAGLIYGLPVLTQIAFIFMCILYDVYQLTGLLAAGLRENMTIVLAYAVWDTMHLAQLFIITMACHLAARQADSAARLITRLILSHNAPAAAQTSASIAFYEELHSFSLQLLHSHLEFSACGLFPINLKMLCAFVGAATTYLVIVVQN